MQEVVVSENNKMAKMLYEMKQDEIRTIEEDKIRERNDYRKGVADPIR